MNGDGKPDLVFSDYVSNSIFVLINTTPAGFELSATALSPATITAGNSATSTGTITRTFGFSGTVNLSCSISPSPAEAPACSLPGSVNVTKGTLAPFTVTVSTTAAVTTGTISYADLPAGGLRFALTLLLLGAGLVFAGSQRRRPALAAVIVLGMATWVSCGGGGSSLHTTPGTPAGTYTATITAKAGSLNHNTTLTFVVQ
jgi:hypothetical protein